MKFWNKIFEVKVEIFCILFYGLLSYVMFNYIIRLPFEWFSFDHFIGIVILLGYLFFIGLAVNRIYQEFR